MRHRGSGGSRVRISRTRLSVAADVLGPPSAEAPLAMHHAEKKPFGAPQRPENELVALLWVLAALLACLVALWWLGEHLYS
jgi:hypothetical protein